MELAKFKAALSGGVRGNLYEVVLTFPQIDGMPAGLTDKASFLIKSASMPESKVGRIDINYRGRVFKYPGDREFADWSVTILNDSALDLRNAFEVWLNAMNQHEANTPRYDLNSLLVEAEIRQLDRSRNVIKTYKFRDMFPDSMSAIDVSFENQNTIQEFSVNFAYALWTSDKTS